ncbi:MAG: deoxyribodipyrimidine photolyase [Vicinamibacterales bacterium]
MPFAPGDPRLSVLRGDPPAAGGRIVLYWMVAARRTRCNRALARALGHARALRKPLVVFEPLRVDYPWASLRHHQFVVEGMRDQARTFAATPIHYLPYVEPEPRAARGLLEALAREAAVVVTDRSPAFFLPRMLDAAVAHVPCRFEAVDDNGVLPLDAATRVYPTAYAFRRFVQKTLPAVSDELLRAREPNLRDVPALRPADRAWLATLAVRWPPCPVEVKPTLGLAALPIDRSVGPAVQGGGERAAQETLERFLRDGLPRYGEDRNQPDLDGSSNLSPYLHFGHISATDVCRRVLAQAGWAGECSARTDGRREGWWGLDVNVEGFLDELITWREVGFNAAAHLPRYDQFDTLPPWARDTLARHAGDPRPTLYDFDTLDAAATHDELWNAAQRQLVREGRLHNMLRMLWGKKILEWSATPEAAFEAMVYLNNRYAVDGRDPNSYSGIAWVLGRYDRAWGPERPIFGTIRYMSSTNTARKVRVKEYLRRYAPSTSLFG